eukprot:584560-Pelagomonas_calceolata.AAC.1
MQSQGPLLLANRVGHAVTDLPCMLGRSCSHKPSFCLLIGSVLQSQALLLLANRVGHAVTSPPHMLGRSCSHMPPCCWPTLQASSRCVLAGPPAVWPSCPGGASQRGSCSLIQPAASLAADRYEAGLFSATL